ncbi:hypothetical protein LSH36_375g02076 [Paralvinella palmiformis]|uniref:Uncharacterized protein n=1 Tax=Paralvinella palmiformis TaxID=53620 RepID=A0AAD9JEA2_9ANNE|nr:hypothetical protein LSH36_375g02076 [Paralvinella palmiformis]
MFSICPFISGDFIGASEGISWKTKWTPSLRDRTLRRILLSKGSSVTPRKIQMSFQGQLKASEVVEAMEQLCREGFGVFYQTATHPKNRFFRKANPNFIDANLLLTYNISLDQYRRSYSDCPRTRTDLSEPAAIFCNISM